MFELDPLPVETEFRVQSIKHRLHEVSREELESFLTEALSLLVNMTHQVKQMKDHLESLEGKSE